MRIIISGAGIAGPTAAYWLARGGHRVTLVERCTSLTPIGQNIDLDGGALRVVEKMGLKDGLRTLNTTERGTRVIRPDGQGVIAEFPVVKGRTVSPTSENEILRGDLARLLCSATLEHPKVRYVLGTTIVRIGDDKTGSRKAEESIASTSTSKVDEDVKKINPSTSASVSSSPPLLVELSNGEKATYDVCILADGQWSRLRKQHFPPPTIIDKDMYIAYFTIPRTSVDQGWWEIYHALSRRGISTRPDSHGTTRGSFTKMPETVEEKAQWEEASRSGNRQKQNSLLVETFEDAGWQSKRLLDEMVKADDFYFQAVKQIRLAQWHDSSTGRIVCIGDAAYAPAPITGAGATLAILGGYVLAGELNSLTVDQHPLSALTAYEAQLRPFVEKIQDLPSFVPGIMMPATWWHRVFLHKILWLASKLIAIPWFQPRAARHGEEAFKLPIYPGFTSEEEQ